MRFTLIESSGRPCAAAKRAEPWPSSAPRPTPAAVASARATTAAASPKRGPPGSRPSCVSSIAQAIVEPMVMVSMPARLQA